jgi:hypothetical protein
MSTDMLMRHIRTTLAACALLALAGTAHAGPINIFNTGVDVLGNPLSDGTIGDPHYLLLSVPSGTTDISVRTSVGGFPIGPWIGDDLLSAWIGPNNDSSLNGDVGNYDYRTTFDLTGFIPASAVLTGQWATDNPGVDILINGTSTGFSASGFTDWTPFSISSGFVSGVNTLDFIVNNQGGPTGLRTEVTGTATAVESAVPEPGTLLMLGAGLGMTAFLRRRRA